MEEEEEEEEEETVLGFQGHSLKSSSAEGTAASASTDGETGGEAGSDDMVQPPVDEAQLEQLVDLGFSEVRT